MLVEAAPEGEPEEEDLCLGRALLQTLNVPYLNLQPYARSADGGGGQGCA